MTNPYNSGTRWDTFGIRSDLFQELQEVAPKKETIDHLVESEKEMAGRLDLLDPIMDFGQSYMPAGLNFRGTGKIPFRRQRGPARGVVIENDGLRLLGKGAWQITSDIRPSWIVSIGQSYVMPRSAVTRQTEVYIHTRNSGLRLNGSIRSHLGPILWFQTRIILYPFTLLMRPAIVSFTADGLSHG